MEKKKVISIIVGILIIIIAVIMPFHLRQICYEYSMHQQEWSLGAWDAVQISSILYSSVICVLTFTLVLINVLRKKTN